MATNIRAIPSGSTITEGFYHNRDANETYITIPDLANKQNFILTLFSSRSSPDAGCPLINVNYYTYIGACRSGGGDVYIIVFNPSSDMSKFCTYRKGSLSDTGSIGYVGESGSWAWASTPSWVYYPTFYYVTW